MTTDEQLQELLAWKSKVDEAQKIHVIEKDLMMYVMKECRQAPFHLRSLKSLGRLISEMSKPMFFDRGNPESVPRPSPSDPSVSVFREFMKLPYVDRRAIIDRAHLLGAFADERLLDCIDTLKAGADYPEAGEDLEVCVRAHEFVKSQATPEK